MLPFKKAFRTPSATPAMKQPGFTSRISALCDRCRGIGKVSTESCTTCNGTGQAFVRDKEIIFDIPEGVNVGSKFVARGQGRKGLNGGQDGDVGIIVTGVKRPDINKLTGDKLEELKNLLGDL